MVSGRRFFSSGLLEGLPLYGDELIARWRARVAVYPDGLRRAAIEHHWRFFPLWFYDDAIALRDSELWRLDMLLEAAFNLLGVLAALNRVYYARFELKRLRKLEAKLVQDVSQAFLANAPHFPRQEALVGR